MTLLIRLYQLFVSPVFLSLGCQCRFYPSCSAYARTAFEKYSWWTAMRLSMQRILRCHPGHPGGIDPV
ncbi:MAG: membrane protein insertion efficiency factor YidD [Deltaproteobacteria bacterium CG11_big_fil_rev_8_21_14_0_20_47_16]|nr:MAG: membrane protein insertion efficiency factor YidD [Deltaproteobacteria bacterium CG11_big_fil_rev_8_21_14_0_20_47_16]